MNKSLLNERRKYVQNQIKKRSTKSIEKRVNSIAKKLFLSARTIWRDVAAEIN